MPLFLAGLFAHPLHFFGLSLHFLESCGQPAGFLGVVLVFLVARLEYGKQLLVVGGLAQYPHYGGAEEQRDEVIEVEPGRVIVEYERTSPA